MDKETKGKHDELLMEAGRRYLFAKCFFPDIIDVEAKRDEDGNIKCDVDMAEFIDRGLVTSTAFEFFSKPDFLEVFADDIKEAYANACGEAAKKLIDDEEEVA